MLNLIITVISIALVAVLAAASVFYGGKAWSEGSVSASASHLISSAQQVAAGITLYNNNQAAMPPSIVAAAGSPVSVSSVIGNLTLEGIMTSVPSLPNNVDDFNVQIVSSTDRQVQATIYSQDICLKVNDRAGGINGPFVCTATLVDGAFQSGAFVYRF